MYIVHLKPDQTKSVPERIDEWGVGSQNGHQVYIYHPINLHGGDFQFVNLFIIC